MCLTGVLISLCDCFVRYVRLCFFGVIQIRISDPRSVWIMYIKGTGESTLVMDSLVSLMHHDPDRSWIADLDPDHPKGMQPKCKTGRTMR